CDPLPTCPRAIYLIFSLMSIRYSLLMLSWLWLMSVCVTQARSSISELEARQAEITTRLKLLSYPSLNTGVAPIGYRSSDQPTAHSPVSITVHLSDPARIDQIVLVPTIWRASNHDFKADAFPKALRIMGKSESGEMILLKDIPDTSHLLPRIAPVVIPLTAVEKLNQVTVEAYELSPRAINNDYVFQLAEVFLFSGERNVALHQKVSSPDGQFPPKTWGAQYLVDGIVPYLMDSSRGDSALSFVSEYISASTVPTLSMDLKSPHLINGIRLHTINQGDTLPQTYPGDYGLPKHFVLEAASDASFSDPVIVIEAHIKAPGPIHSWTFPSTKARHLRLRILELYLYHGKARFGLAEFELLSHDQNILLGEEITTNFPKAAPILHNKLLTDGRNYYGNILPLRQWMEELAERHDLENEQSELDATLNKRYQAQQKNFQLTLWILSLISVGLIALLLYARLKMIRNETLIRERISSNLHDELGANLHALGLLGKLVEQSLDKPDRLKTLAQRIHTLTHLTGYATRNCSHMLRNKNLHNDLLSEMKRQAKTLLVDLSYELEIKGQDLLQKLSRRTCIDLHLFHKEALTNIIKHSGAENVRIKLTLHRRSPHLYVSLDIIDDGTGITEPPPSLTRRAKLLKAALTCLPAEQGGSHLQLRFKRLSLI
ncbi:MAG: ATP-binding protein, partial [Akkermansiaceae bacterium]